MFTKVSIFFTISLAIINAKLMTPRDIADEIKGQLQELHSIVQGEILAAHGDIDNGRTDFDTNAMNVMQSASVSLEEEHGNIDVSLNSIKDLASSAHADISLCTDGVEGVLIRLPRQYAQQLGSCIYRVDSQPDSITVNARYVVDVVINKVNQLEFQANQCGENLVCLSPIMTEIQLDKIRLPQNIRTEVEAYKTLLNTLKLSVENCATDAVTQYVVHAGSLLNDILTCVNSILA